MTDGRELRPVLTGLFLFGSIGTGAELLLLGHVEDAWQQSPLVLIAVGCILRVIVAISPASPALRAFQLTMIAFVASGAIGVGLHYDGNIEFERELSPDASGFPLFWESLRGATPVLAPGTMMLLGALGLTSTARERATG